MSKTIKLKLIEDLDENGYYFIRYQDRSSSSPREFRSTRELFEHLAMRINNGRNDLWSIEIEKHNDWEKVEREQLARLKAIYEPEGKDS